jgi:hypothetical protein
MNDSATRPPPCCANAIAIPAAVIVLIASGADAGRMPRDKSPTWRSLPFIGGPDFAICADSTIRTVSPVGRMPIAAPRSRMSGATTSPCHSPSRRYDSPRRSRIVAA